MPGGHTSAEGAGEKEEVGEALGDEGDEKAARCDNHDDEQPAHVPPSLTTRRQTERWGLMCGLATDSSD